MLYDDRISSEVPLQKILDHFLESGEKPSVVVKFLRMYGKQFREILGGSRFYERIFRIDFAGGLRSDDLDWIIGKGLDEDFKGAATLVWQILIADGVPHGTKRRVRRFVGKIVYAHPHHGYAGVTARKLDLILAHWGRDVYQMAQTLNDIDFNEYCCLMSGVERSVFLRGMLQSDFFNCLETKRQYVFMRNVFETTDHISSIENFMFQFMTEEHPVEMKNELIDFLKVLETKHLENTFLPENIRARSDRAKSWPELAIWVNLGGVENLFDELID